MAVNDTVAGAVAIYNPNGPLAIVAFLAYGAVAIALWTRYFRTRPRAKYMRNITWGVTFMSLGYICRFTRRNHINAWSWLFETLFILLSPCAFLAQDYVLLSRLIVYLDAEAEFLLNRRAFVIIFILADIVTVLTQLGGTALTITFGKLVSIGQKLVTAGLWVQLVFFTGFMLVFFIWWRRIRRQARTLKQQENKPKRSRWMALLFAIGSSCICLTVRSVYRVAEYTAGALGQSEAAFYILDTVPLLLNVAIFVMIWPPICLSEDGPADTPLSGVARREG